MITKPIPFDAVCLASVVAEVQPLIGAKVQKISQPNKFSVVFSLYKNSEVFLMISADPRFPRAHLISKRGGTGEEPSNFCMKLRKMLLNGRVQFIRQRGLDRILEIGISSSEGDFQLVAELMGKHSNLMVVNHNKNIQAALKIFTDKQSKRPVLLGKEYLPPPFDPKPSLLEAKEGENHKQFEGVSPFLSTLVESGLNISSVQSILKSGKFEASIVPGIGVYPLPLNTLTDKSLPAENLSRAFERHFDDLIETLKLQEAKNALQGQLSRVYEARVKALQDIENAIVSAENAPTWQMYGELLLAYQGQIADGDKQATVFDYEGQEITIKLNPEKNVIENSNNYFYKAKHAKERIDEVTQQKSFLAQEEKAMKLLLDKLENAETLIEIEAIKTEADKKNWLHHHVQGQKKEDRPYQGFSIRELVTPGGWKLLYGTNATSNDYLTTRVGKGNDWWLHVRGQTSAHVVLQTKGQPDKVQREDLIFAAQIAVKNSIAKNSSHVPVDYTLCKYVRKPRKSAPGFATYTHEKTLHVDP